MESKALRGPAPAWNRPPTTGLLAKIQSASGLQTLGLGGRSMLKASEYRQHARECRTLATKMHIGEHRDQLLAMAATWDRMAEERERTALLVTATQPAAPDITP